VGDLRVREHPILGGLPPRRTVKIFFEGREIEAFEGEPIAAALLAAGVTVFRRSPRSGEGRGLFCGIGRCTDCVMVVNGLPGVRTCITPVEEGMDVRMQHGLGPGR
jgi:predicted molibdopterin-dependent oxidoreductase YjgC